MTALMSRVSHTGKFPKIQSHAPMSAMTVMASSLAVGRNHAVILPVPHRRAKDPVVADFFRKFRG